MKQWTLEELKSQEGKIAVITGGSGGIGFHAALELARKGARVIIASDDTNKGLEAVKTIADQVPHADIGYENLDLADLDSVRMFAMRMRSSLPALDILILNGGISGVPRRMESPDGHELTFATNYLGHFALTALVFPLLLQIPDSRVISIGSLDHRHAHLDFDNLNAQKRYDATDAYARSKLALMLFSFELHRRVTEKGLFLKSLSVHPGAARTEIFDKGPREAGNTFAPSAVIKRLSLKTLGQSAARGSLPILFAATSREAKSGEYYGPDGFQELWGDHPVKAKLAIQAMNITAAQRLWSESEKLTGVSFDFGGVGLSHHH